MTPASEVKTTPASQTRAGLPLGQERGGATSTPSGATRHGAGASAGGLCKLLAVGVFAGVCLLAAVGVAAGCAESSAVDPDTGDARVYADVDGTSDVEETSDLSSDTHEEDTRSPDSTPDSAPDTAPGGGGAALYPADRTQSPITASVAEHLRAIAAVGSGLSDQVFAKVGASASASVHFMHCFAGNNVELDGRDELAATLAHFSVAVAGTTPYDRESLSTAVGWSASSAIAGSPSPLQQELDATGARFAVVMYGTNDIQRHDIHGYADDMLDLTDALIGQGVVPLLTSIMPRDDDAAADLWVPHYNAVVRAVAQGRQVPFIDYHRALLPLADHGLGGDHLHPSVYSPPEGARACVFTAEGLAHGYNIRNLLTLEALDRAKRAVVDAQPAPDAQAPTLHGDGSTKAPFLIEQMPFSDLRDTTQSPFSSINSYAGCNASQDESGPEYFYRLEVRAPTRVRATVYDRGDVDVDVHLLDESMLGAGCVDRDHLSIVADLAPGVHHFVIDTFVSAGVAQGGEYVFVVVEDNGAQ